MLTTKVEVPEPRVEIQHSRKKGKYVHSRQYVWPDFTHIQIGVADEPPKPAEIKRAKESYLRHQHERASKQNQDGGGSPGNG